jgi:hypothetical protein
MDDFFSSPTTSTNKTPTSVSTPMSISTPAIQNKEVPKKNEEDFGASFDDNFF